MQQIDKKQVDALGIIAKEAAMRSSEALSKLIGIPVKLEMAQTRILEVEQLTNILAAPQENVYAVVLPVRGEGNSGSSALISSLEESHRLAELLMKKPQGSIKELDVMSASAVTETSNIIGGAFLSVLSNTTGISLVQSVPKSYKDTLKKIIDVTVSGIDAKNRKLSIAFETDFELSTATIANEKIITHYVFLLEVAFAQKLLDALKK